MTDTPRHSHIALPAVSALVALILLLILAPSASAKQVIASFGTDVGFGTLGGEFRHPGDIAVNWTGSGGVPPGTIYVTEGASPERNQRIQRFYQDDNGTPANPYDDSYDFVSAWGADVVAPGGTGDVGGEANAAFEVCTVAAECQRGLFSGGNGTAAGNGSLASPGAIAVDQDTGFVYVSDSLFRVSVFSAQGVFLRSFGRDVAASGPGDTGTGYEVCVAADGDVCKAGTSGSGAGEIGGVEASVAVSQPDGNPASGTVFLTDSANQRIDTYAVDGSSLGSIGSPTEFEPSYPRVVAVDSRGIVYASNGVNSVARYDTEDANGGGVGFLAPIEATADEKQQLSVKAGAGTFKLSFAGDTTADLAFNTSAAALDAALEALPSVGVGNVVVVGGPGNATGSAPYAVTFTGALGGTDVPALVASDGAPPLGGGSGGSSATVQTTASGQAGPLLYAEINGGSLDLEVDPDSDGAGPDEDALYVLRIPPAFDGDGIQSVIQQLGPGDPPGLSAPPTVADDLHGDVVRFNFTRNLGLDPSRGRLFVSTQYNIGGAYSGGTGDHRVYVLDTAGGAAAATLDSIGDVTDGTATLNGTVDPNGPPDVSYRVEYSLDGTNWLPTAPTAVGSQETPQPVSAVLDPPGKGLTPNTLYHVRLVALRPFNPPVVTPALTFTTDPSPPRVETVGSPVRTATTAQLNGRVNPRGNTTQYWFEYGAGGPCSANPCEGTDPIAVGSEDGIKFAADRISGLASGTTYHYRLVAGNGNPGSPSFGDDMTVRTRDSDESLVHGDLPGPPGSDRNYELVNLPDTSGNPVPAGLAFSDDGDRAVYNVYGGTPLSDTGTAFNIFFAERGPAGWQSARILPARSEATGSLWSLAGASGDLSTIFARNFNSSTGAMGAWRMRPGVKAEKLAEVTDTNYSDGGPPLVPSSNAMTVTMPVKGPYDPLFPGTPPNQRLLYRIGAGEPQLLSILPDGTVPGCGLGDVSSAPRGQGWVSAEGEVVYFTSSGNNCEAPAQLYARDLAQGQTSLVSPAPISGPTCGAVFLQSVPGAVFLRSAGRLVPEDTAQAGCPDAALDVYRYELADGTLTCVTCLVPGLDSHLTQGVVIASDGSRMYFMSSTSLLPGAEPLGIYRVDVESGAFAYVAPGRAGPGLAFNANAVSGNAINSDGSVFVFRSNLAQIDSANGSTNAGSEQYYRYDDRDRSLVCVSCPQDGDDPIGSVEPMVSNEAQDQKGPNITPLAEDGDIAFGTPTPLLPIDVNTPRSGENSRQGTDIYEWRDGRLLLVTDGRENWQVGAGPQVAGITPSGQDVFFTAATRYTPDAVDAYLRLYTARIGGGFEFPPPPPPCPLEVCQGTPLGAPNDPVPASVGFRGLGNTLPEPRSCTAPARKARHLSRSAGRLALRAKRVRRAAARSSDPTGAAAALHAARRLASGAKHRAAAARRLRAGTKRCRVARKRADSDRRAER